MLKFDTLLQGFGKSKYKNSQMLTMCFRLLVGLTRPTSFCVLVKKHFCLRSLTCDCFRYTIELLNYTTTEV